MINEDVVQPLETKKSANPRRALVIAGLIVLLAAALLLVDFRLMHGQFNAEHMVSTIAFGREGQQQIVLGQDVDLYFQGTDLFTRSMVRPFIHALEQNPAVGEVHLLEGLPQKADHPVMVVRVDQSNLLWLLVYGRAQIKLHMSYATNGEVDWMDDKVVASLPGPYSKWISGEFTGSDNSFGLISLPGYTGYLGQQFGEKIGGAIQTALKD